MGLEIPTLVIGAKVEKKLDGLEISGEVVRMFSDAVVVETEGTRLYVPADEFDRWEVVSRPRYTLEDGRGYL